MICTSEKNVDMTVIKLLGQSVKGDLNKEFTKSLVINYLSQNYS